MSSQLTVVILAAGQGTRMKSDLPKVLHTIAGKPLLTRVIDSALALKPSAIHVVYGHGGEQVQKQLSGLAVNWVLQEQQLGTGHAVNQAMATIADTETVLVLYGDVPLISSATLANLVTAANDDGLGLLTAKLPDPSGYGRIVRNRNDKVSAIFEQKDATREQLEINEINTGMLAVNAGRLRSWLNKISNENAQGEYYLTDIIAMAAADAVAINAISTADLSEIEGVNNKLQLANLERVFQRRQADAVLLQGATLRDPNRFDVRGEFTFGRDVEIDVGVLIEGKVSVGDRCYIGPNCILKDVVLGNDVRIEANSLLEASTLGDECVIGPYARLRPDCQLAERVKIGNFVEVKKTTVASGSKINHLSYVGDTQVGENVNVGAGTITCNYDGANKHLTVIGDNAFIGSGTQLVAPVTIGKGATIGAGSTITRDVPDGLLALSRSEQKMRKGWLRPVKNKG